MAIIISILYARIQILFSTWLRNRKLQGLQKHWAPTSKQYIRTAVTDGIISSDMKIYDWLHL